MEYRWLVITQFSCKANLQHIDTNRQDSDATSVCTMIAAEAKQDKTTTTTTTTTTTKKKKKKKKDERERERRGRDEEPSRESGSLCGCYDRQFTVTGPYP